MLADFYIPKLSNDKKKNNLGRKIFTVWREKTPSSYYMVYFISIKNITVYIACSTFFVSA